MRNFRIPFCTVDAIDLPAPIFREPVAVGRPEVIVFFKPARDLGDEVVFEETPRLITPLTLLEDLLVEPSTFLDPPLMFFWALRF